METNSHSTIFKALSIIYFSPYIYNVNPCAYLSCYTVIKQSILPAHAPSSLMKINGVVLKILYQRNTTPQLPHHLLKSTNSIAGGRS